MSKNQLEDGQGREGVGREQVLGVSERSAVPGCYSAQAKQVGDMGQRVARKEVDLWGTGQKEGTSTLFKNG